MGKFGIPLGTPIGLSRYLCAHRCIISQKYASLEFKNCFITTVDNKNFDSIVENMEEYNTFVICLLDNKTQIQKTYEKIMISYKKQVLID